MRIKLNLAILALALFVVSCGQNSSTESTTDSSSDLSGNDYLVTIKTDLGDMKAILYDETPKHKENFIKLANEGFFDSLLFHRVINSFMIQGGDPDSKSATMEQRLGSGGPGYTVPAEFVPELIHKKGALSAARQGDAVNPQRNSSGSQFYIVQGQVYNDASLQQFDGPDVAAIQNALAYMQRALPDHDLNREYQEALQTGGSQAYNDKVMSTLDRLAEASGMTFERPPMSEERKEIYKSIGGTPFLDDQYTVFGMVVDGLDVLDRIAAVQTRNPGREDRPLEDIRMYVSIEEVSKSEIVEKYGNPYIN